MNTQEAFSDNIKNGLHVPLKVLQANILHQYRVLSVGKVFCKIYDLLVFHRVFV